MKKLTGVLSVLLFFGLTLGAQATTILYDNLNSDPNHYDGLPYAGGHYNLGNGSSYFAYGVGFIPVNDGILEGFDLGITRYGTSSNIQLRLFEESELAANNSMWTYNVAVTSQLWDLLSIHGLNGPMLEQGSKYYLTATPAGANDTFSWYYNNRHIIGDDVCSNDGINWTVRPDVWWGNMAICVTSGNSGDTVPEPTTIILFGFGLLGLTGVGRRKGR